LKTPQIKEVRQWFKRFAEVPNAGYPGHPSIDRLRLRGHDVEARLEVWKDYDGKRQESLRWGQKDSWQSSSPASTHWMDFDNRGKPSTPQETIKRAFESLELPGTLSDYHWTLEAVSMRLWDDRKKQPRLLGAVEQFCLQDVRLIEAHPKLNDHLDLHFEPSHHSFQRLIDIYEREGFFHNAFSLVRRAQIVTKHELYAEKSLSLIGRLNRLSSDGV